MLRIVSIKLHSQQSSASHRWLGMMNYDVSLVGFSLIPLLNRSWGSLRRRGARKNETQLTWESAECVQKVGKSRMHSTLNQATKLKLKLKSVSIRAALAELEFCNSCFTIFNSFFLCLTQMWQKIDIFVLIVVAVLTGLVSADNEESLRDTIKFTVFAK